MDLLQEVLDIAPAREFHERLDFPVDWVVDLNVLDTSTIVDNRQKFTLDSLSTVFDLEETMNVRRALLFFVDISAVGR